MVFIVNSYCINSEQVDSSAPTTPVSINFDSQQRVNVINLHLFSLLPILISHFRYPRNDLRRLKPIWLEEKEQNLIPLCFKLSYSLFDLTFKGMGLNKGCQVPYIWLRLDSLILEEFQVSFTTRTKKKGKIF